MTTITAYFTGLPGDDLDETCDAIFESYHAERIGAGTFLPTSERDVEYDVPESQAKACRKALKEAGFRLKSMATTPISEEQQAQLYADLEKRLGPISEEQRALQQLVIRILDDHRDE